MNASRPSGDASRLAVVQGTYYLLTGLWPVFSPGSFQWVTGPKVDVWLVKTVGALTAVTGTGLIMAGKLGRVTPEIRLLGLGTAAAFAAVDTNYVLRRRIRPVYLLDALGELGLLAAWLLRQAEDRQT